MLSSDYSRLSRRIHQAENERDLDDVSRQLNEAQVDESERSGLILMLEMQRNNFQTRSPLDAARLRCSFCGAAHPDPHFARNYYAMVCRECERRSLNLKGQAPTHESMQDDGDNPVFIDAIQCWRRYRFGGFVTMKDEDLCPDLMAFCRKHLAEIFG